MIESTTDAQAFDGSADAETALYQIIAEIDGIRTAIKADDDEIARMKTESRVITARTDDVLAQVRAQIDSLVAYPIAAA